MALIDDLRKAAQQKPTYRPDLPMSGTGLQGLTRQPTIQRDRVDHNRVLEMLQANRAPNRVPGSVLPGGRSFAEMADIRRSGQTVNDDGTIETPGPSLASKMFSGIIDVVDTPRAAVVSTIKEGWDAAEGDGFSTSEWLAQTRDNYRFGDLMADKDAFQDDNWERFAKPVVGFVGDVAADPLTYLGVGTVRRGAQGIKGAASALDNALISGSRRGLAEEVAAQAAARGVANDAVDGLIREAGKRGRGAFTTKGLARSGTSRETLEQLGLTHRFGYSIGGTRHGTRVGVGGRRLAEASENLKGNLKKAFGNTTAASTFRRLFVGSDSAIGQAERRFVNEVITGGAQAPEMARALGVIRLATRDAYGWLDTKTTDVTRQFHDLPKLSKDEAIKITHAIEAGDFSDEMASRISKWYDDTGRELQELGVEFGWQDNYVNHMLTPRARRELIKGNAKLASLNLDAAEAFQKTRTLKAGDEFLDETLETATIQEINDIAQRKLGFKLYEDDVRVMMSGYLNQAMQARMKRQVYNLADERNLNVKVAADAKEAVEQATQESAELLKKSADTRKAGLAQAAKDAGVQRKQVAADLHDVEKRLNDSIRNLKELEEATNVAAKRLQDTQDGLARWERILEGAKKSRTKENAALKAKATRQIKKLTKEADELRGEHAEKLAKLGRARTSKSIHRLGQEANALKKQLADVDAQVSTADAARKAMDDPSVPVPGTEHTAEQAARMVEKVTETHKRFVASKAEHFDASAAFVYQLANDNTISIRLNNRLDELDQVIASKKGAGQAGVGELRERTKAVVDSFDQLELNEAAQAVRASEAQALAYDITAGTKLLKAGEVRKQAMDALGDTRFQEHMQTVLEDGYRVINEKVAVPEWFDQAFQSIPRTQAQWGRLRTTIERYDQALNWWKGYATTSPGFVFRNLYGGMYGMYLDGVSPKNVKKFNGFLKQYHEASGTRRIARKMAAQPDRDWGLEHAKSWARKKGYSEDEIAHMEQALQAASASGWGLNPQEVSTQLVGAKGSWNPFNVEFKPTRAIRGASTNVEAIMRGSHAYDVLRRGGSIDEATRHVEMFHFNYRDISEFDRNAKRVIPFWTFYSRNMALQAQVWTRYPQKLNRTYFNLKENLESQSDPDQVVPGYYEEMGAIRLPFGENDGGKWYATPDLPSLRFRQDFAQLSGSGDDGFQPERFLSDASPLFKVVGEGLAGKEFFTDIPYKNRMYDYDSNGNMVPRKATDVLQGEIPGTDFEVPIAGELIQRAADVALGDKAQLVNDELLITDRGESIVEDSNPILGRLARLAPNNPKFEDRELQSWLSFGGLSARQNTEQSIRGELYGRNMDRQEAGRQQAIQEMLQGMTGG